MCLAVDQVCVGSIPTRETMFKPKEYPNKYCTMQHRFIEGVSAVNLIPHVKTMQSIPGKKIYTIDFWYCPECGLVYYFKDLTKIVEEE